MSDPYHQSGPSGTGLVRDMLPITPSDGTDNVGTGNVAIGLYVEGGGAVAFITRTGATRTVTVASNAYLACSVTRVKSTGTTATGIHALIA